MANPPLVRPWSRLASLRPAPAPAQEPHPPSAQTTFRTTSAQPIPSLQTQPSQQPSEPNAAPPRPAPLATASGFAGATIRTSAPSSPAKKVPTPPSTLPSLPSLKASQSPKTSTLDKNANATKSPQRTIPHVQTPMQPQKKLITPPPSPLALPPSQLKVNLEVEPKIPVEAEPKTELFQKESSEIQKQGFGHHEKQVVAKEKETKGKGIHKKVSDSEESGIRVITIAGENKGAYMEILQSSKQPKYLHKKGKSKIKAYDYESENSGSGEGNTNRKDKNQKERTPSSRLMTAYINSNVQCVNNSLMYHTSCTQHDPGVHLTLSKKPFGEGFHLK